MPPAPYIQAARVYRLYCRIAFSVPLTSPLEARKPNWSDIKIRETVLAAGRSRRRRWRRWTAGIYIYAHIHTYDAAAIFRVRGRRERARDGKREWKIEGESNSPGRYSAVGIYICIYVYRRGWLCDKGNNGGSETTLLARRSMRRKG